MIEMKSTYLQVLWLSRLGNVEHKDRIGILGIDEEQLITLENSIRDIFRLVALFSDLLSG
jgi:hypothetical protein